MNKLTIEQRDEILQYFDRSLMPSGVVNIGRFQEFLNANTEKEICPECGGYGFVFKNQIAVDCLNCGDV